MRILPKKVEVVEVVCRDGFQIEKKFIPTMQKIETINKLSRLGFKRLEITSFVKDVPQMSDAKSVVNKIDRMPGVVYAALVPNLKGAEFAIESGIDVLDAVMTASESLNMSNFKMSIVNSISTISKIIDLSAKNNKKVIVYIGASFGCPYEGNIPQEKVINFAEKFLELGASGISFSDTTGMANPYQVFNLVSEFLKRNPDTYINLHFHNTRGMGNANILAALQAGATSFDASLGGMGGCPYAAGATGNVATEDVVYMLEEMNISTGIDLDGLLDAAKYLEKIIGKKLPGHIIRAGKKSDLCQLTHC